MSRLPVLKPGNVLVRNAFSLVSAGTEKAVLEFSQANYLQKARMRPDLFCKVLNKARNDGFLETYKVVSRLIEQKSNSATPAPEPSWPSAPKSPISRSGSRSPAPASSPPPIPKSSPSRATWSAPVPRGVPLEEASFVTLGAIALQGVRLADLALSENVVVYGLGLVGMVVAQLAVAAGCRVIGVDIDPRKLQRAAAFGVTPLPVDDNLQASVLSPHRRLRRRQSPALRGDQEQRSHRTRAGHDSPEGPSRHRG